MQTPSDRGKKGWVDEGERDRGKRWESDRGVCVC